MCRAMPPAILLVRQCAVFAHLVTQLVTHLVTHLVTQLVTRIVTRLAPLATRLATSPIANRYRQIKLNA